MDDKFDKKSFVNYMRMDNRSERTIRHYLYISERIPKRYFLDFDVKGFNQWLIKSSNTISVKSHISATYKKYLESVGEKELSRTVMPGKYESNEVIDFIKEEHFKKILSVTKDKQMRLMLKVLYHTGMRRGILLNFTKDMLDEEEHQIFIYDKNLEGNKSKDKFRIYVPEDIFDDLIAYSKKLKIGDKDRVFVLRKSSGEEYPYQGQTFTHKVCALGKRAGFSWVSPHKFRHGFATRHRRQGKDATLIQRVMGQKDPRALKRYDHMSGGDINKEMEE